MTEPKIKPQYKLFAKYYCGECAGNAEKSAIAAGYSRSYARGNSHKLLARSDVQEYIKYINTLAETDDEKIIADVSDIQAFWTAVFSDAGNAIKDRLKASELLAKAKGMFKNDDW